MIKYQWLYAIAQMIKWSDAITDGYMLYTDWWLVVLLGDMSLVGRVFCWLDGNSPDPITYLIKSQTNI